MEAELLVLYVMLYVLLPLWGVAGMLDWWCHRKTNIESTSGLHEATIHCVMGTQIGLPITLSLLFEVNVLILILCLLILITHELVAHYDVHFTTGKREISIWEIHAHNYLSTLPLFMVILIIIRKWDVFMKLISLDFAGEFALEWRKEPLGASGNYAMTYMTVMAILVVFPYMQEWWRCYTYERAQRKD